MTPHEQSLRRWFQFVVSACVALGVSILLTWMIILGEAPLFTWLLWALYGMQLGMLLLFLIIRRPWAIAVNEAGAPGETPQARAIRALSVNTDHALLTLYGVLMIVFPVVAGIILFVATLLSPLLGGVWAILVGLVFVPLASVHLYASFLTTTQYGIVRPRARILETGRASLHTTNLV